MHAMRLDQPGPPTDHLLRSIDLPLPPVPAGHVGVEVTACGVCRTDLQLASGDLPARVLPIIPGHQVVGRVVAVGDGVASERLGQHVGMAWLAEACGSCRFCRSGRENLCIDSHFTGWDVNGGYATYAVAHGDYAFDLGELLGPAAPERPRASAPARTATDVAPLLCGGVIGYRALRVAGVGPESTGATLGLYGYGASARLVQQVANHWGVRTFAVTRSGSEVSAALAAGAEWAGDYGQAPPVKLDAAITFAPVGDVVISALQALDRGGTVAVNAIHLDRVPQFNYDDLWWERTIRSVANVTRSDVTEFIALVAAANITTEYEVLPLKAANEALCRVDTGDVRGSFVLDCATHE